MTRKVYDVMWRKYKELDRSPSRIRITKTFAEDNNIAVWNDGTIYSIYGGYGLAKLEMYRGGIVLTLFRRQGGIFVYKIPRKHIVSILW